MNAIAVEFPYAERDARSACEIGDARSIVTARSPRALGKAHGRRLGSRRGRQGQVHRQAARTLRVEPRRGGAEREGVLRQPVV